VKAEPSDLSHQEQLAGLLAGQAAARLDAGNRSGAGSNLKEALPLQREMVRQELIKKDWSRGLGIILDLAADPRMNDPQAASLLEESLAISRELSGLSPGNVEWSAGLCATLYHLGSEQAREQRKDIALANLKEALELAKRMEAAGVLRAEQKGWPAIISEAVSAAENGHPVKRSPAVRCIH
jgi:hypothetical protein